MLGSNFDFASPCSARKAHNTRRAVRHGSFKANAADLKDPQMIILFGSHARGDWVDDKYVKEGITYTYRSDFDILVITPTAELARHLGVWREVINRADQPLEDSGDVRSDYAWDIGEGPTPVTIIDHPLAYVNEQIRQHNYFFCDVLREGILLYESGDYKIAEPPELDPKERQEFAQKAYDKWMELAEEFYIVAV